MISNRYNESTDKRGLLIVFEGLDGAGKSTQVDKLAEWLRSIGHQVVITSWNSSKNISGAVKKAKEAQLLTPNCFSGLHAADFFNRLENIIIPSLKAGKVVIADRYSYTALVRDKARGIKSAWVKRIYSLAIEPDLAFLCRIPVDTALKRAKKKKNRLPSFYESGMDVSGKTDPEVSFRQFQSSIDREYEKLVDNLTLVPIDMERNEGDIFNEIKQRVESLIRRGGTMGNIQSTSATHILRNTVAPEQASSPFTLELPEHNFPGKLLVIEGAHNAGVTHQINTLYDWLQIHNVDVVKAGMGRTWITTEILDKAAPKNALSPRTNVMLAMSEMAYILEVKVIPALKRGAVVLLNRYLITTLVFGLLRGLERDWLVDTLKGYGIRPDITIFIDPPFDVLLKRSDLSSLIATNSIYSGLDIGFTRDIETSFDFYQRSSLDAYSDIALSDGLPVIDGSMEPEKISRMVIDHVAKGMGIESDTTPEDKVLREVLDLYHKHNGYFEHAQKVREFAVQTFDATIDLHGMSTRARRLLEYAALLHDVGRSVVGANAHEKQSYRIIMDNEFHELSKGEKRIIAAVALYHNGSQQSLDRSKLWKLRSDEQTAVRRLAAILRIADGLDASNKQVIDRLRISREDFGGTGNSTVLLDLNSVNNAKAEIKSVLSKKDLFEWEFNIPLVLDTNRLERILSQGCSAIPKLFREKRPYEAGHFDGDEE